MPKHLRGFLTKFGIKFAACSSLMAPPNKSIGGKLIIATIEQGEMTVKTQVRVGRNHAIGSRNLCLGVISKNGNQLTCFEPNQKRDQVVGFQFLNSAWQEVQRVDLNVAFAIPLMDQFAVENRFYLQDNYIY